MIDDVSWKSLTAVEFTTPVTLEDIEALLRLARSLPWSSKASFDAHSHDGSNVTLTVIVGDRIFKQVYNGHE